MKLCLYCEHWQINLGFGGSDVTPADPPSMQCNKQHYLYERPDTEAEYRKLMERGLTCPDFEKARD